MKVFKSILILFVLAVMVACENDKSIQKYYVENQQDTDFLALDVPTSLFTNSETLESDQKETLETIKKINVLALKKEVNPAKFEAEKEKLNDIFTDEKYQLLMKYGGSGRKAELYFIGEEGAIDELIVYGYDDNQGLGIARVLGENMNPDKIMKMMRSLHEEDVNTNGIKGIIDIFGHTSHKNDSAKIENEKPADSLMSQE
ncbi:DUF4252 domain-containing protein [Christiangramia aquimixticola]|uniref:DUF4252 domain-containing protein n=1 Tax=Christiangramia aquimixticola TaxID=1697558 RepID=UPI003AA976D7